MRISCESQRLISLLAHSPPPPPPPVRYCQFGVSPVNHSDSDSELKSFKSSEHMDETVYGSCCGFGYSSFSYFCCTYINEIVIKTAQSTKSLISQWQIAEENSKLDQFIARTMIYCHVLRYINHAFWQARFSNFW